ncbi:hypothetical protein HG531_005102 [Fusarium graminearum]|nr:hypothetical protein HG531_005102 [Fusarium graminearum]
MSVLGNLASHVVSNLGVQAGDKHKPTNFISIVEAGNQVLLERAHAVSQKTGAVEQVTNDQRLVNVEFKLAVHASDSGGNVVAHNLGADHSQGLTLGRVDLARHDTAARLVLGQVQLTKTATGAATKVSDVLCDFGKRSSQGVEGAVGLDNSVVGGEGLELVGGSLELSTGHLCDLLSDSLGKSLESVDASTDSVELGNVTGELLGESERSGVLKVSTADLDDLLGLELVDLLLDSVAQAAESRQELAFNVEDSSNVHDGRKSVVGGSAAVDVVIGVDRLLAAHGTAKNLNGTVGDDLVGVHVGLSTGASLPDDEREVVDELAISDLLGSLLDSGTDLGVYGKQFGGSTLQDTKRLDNRWGHAVLGLVDTEVLEGSLRLSSPVAVGGDLDLAKGIAFYQQQKTCFGVAAAGQASMWELLLGRPEAELTS